MSVNSQFQSILSENSGVGDSPVLRRNRFPPNSKGSRAIAVGLGLFVLLLLGDPRPGLWRPELLVVFLLLPLALLSRDRVLIQGLMPESVVLFMAFAGAAVSLVVQSLATGDFSAKDGMILLRLPYYWAIMAISAVAAPAISSRKFLVFVASLSIGYVFLSFAQYYDLPIVSEWMASNLGARYEWLSEGYAWRRVLGTFGNPNYWGLLGVLLSVGLLAALMSRTLFVLTVLVVPVAYTIALTGSRTAMVALACGTLSVIAVVLVSRKFTPRFSGMGGIMFVALGVVVIAFVPRSYEGWERFSTKRTETLEMRTEIWKKIIREAPKDPVRLVFGSGPRKESVMQFGDNAYLRTFRDHGIFGLMTYVGFLGIAANRSRRQLSLLRESDPVIPTIALSAIFCWVIFELAADAWYYQRVAPLLLILIGMAPSNSHSRQ